MMKQGFFFADFAFSFSLSVFGVNFTELNLSNDDRLLFKAEFESQSAVYLSTLVNVRESENSQYPIQPLTAYPDKLRLVDNGRSIIVTNRFGVARIPVAGGLPASIPGYPSFANGSLPQKGRLQEAAASNDGRWIIYIEPVSPAYGNLFILNTASGAKRIITEKIELAAKDFPVKWSPDSRLFVYEKDSKLYYFPIISDLSVQIDERFRLMGSGSINSVVWGQQGDFFYFSGNTLYSVRNPELFTRTIYGDFLSIGQAIAILPFEFDPNFDCYWIAPNSNYVLINKSNRGIFLFELGRNGGTPSLVNTPIPSSAQNFTVLWSSSGKGKILFRANNYITSIHFEITASNIAPNRNNISMIYEIDSPLSANGALSPDGKKAIFWGEQGLELWDFENWKLTRKLFSEPVLSCAWINNERFVMGSARFISEVNISGATATQRRICLSSADQTGYEAFARGQSRVLARVGSEWFATDTRSGWTPVNDPQLRPVSFATERNRVFLESSVLMIRNLQSISTTPFLSKHTQNKVYPQKSPQKIALCFDLYDDDTGLYDVLAALERNNIKATFFFNGEFIRRNPTAAQAIVQAGHEAGSMFYAPIDLSDSRYRITREFIIQGLARNEDEFISATEKELKPLWHPPFYRSSSSINASAAAAGYTTIEKTLDLFDWVSREESKRLNIYQMSSSQMIEQIVNNRTNSAIIPVRLGTLPGGRDEYLYQRIEVLLDALVKTGIEVVPVSQL